MIKWNFNPDHYDANSYVLIPPGQYRVRIDEAEEMKSKTGKDMIKLTLKVSGYNSKLWYYLVFDNTSAEGIERTDNRLGQVFDSFNIPAGDLNLNNWRGKVGAANVKHETDNRNTTRAVVNYFVRRDKQDILPAWQEQSNSGNVNPEMVKIDNDEIPFF